jgi:fructuronate reductase
MVSPALSHADRPARPLSRTAPGTSVAPPIRAVHLGLGAFFRAHQARYTQLAGQAEGAEPWGIAAFTGRRPDAALPLAAQDGLYHLLERAAEGDNAELVDSLAAALPGDDTAGWARLLAAPTTSLVTITVTEAGYRRDVNGEPDLDDAEVANDVTALKRGEPARTAPGRLVAGLAARRKADAGPIAIVPCDNLPDNAEAVRRVVRGLAELVDPALASWIDDESNVGWVTTVVDRITPATTEADRATVRQLTGFADACPIVTEPFTEWVLAGPFPAGRPAWELAGAHIAADAAEVRRFGERKLWLLNGAHSLLAYAAPALGARTVAEAFGDARARAWVEQWWDEACRHSALPEAELAAYRDALAGRFTNPTIQHLLGQVAMDGSQKLPVRVLPVLRAERAAGRLPRGAVRMIAGWLTHLRGNGVPIRDPRAADLTALAAGRLPEAARRVSAVIDPALAEDADLLAAIVEDATELEALRDS